MRIHPSQNVSEIIIRLFQDVDGVTQLKDQQEIPLYLIKNLKSLPDNTYWKLEFDIPGSMVPVNNHYKNETILLELPEFINISDNQQDFITFEFDYQINNDAPGIKFEGTIMHLGDVGISNFWYEIEGFTKSVPNCLIEQANINNF